MPDHARSADPAVQAQLDRLWRLSPGADVLGLDRIGRLLARLGDPQLALPPVFHVAGTNGKGSTCAFLRAALEAAGHAVHVYSSPHLVRFNERIRIAGRLIDDAALAALLAEVLAVGDGIGASFFEVTTAAAFLAFARTPAAAAIVEVGLGGRLDATNLVQPAVCGIAALGLDHQAFLGDTLLAIAAEKAGIAKPGVPLVTMDYPPPISARVAAVAAAAGAPLIARGETWFSDARAGEVHFADPDASLVLPAPLLVGAHQAENLALAAAMLRRQRAVAVPAAAIRAAATAARWPARLQRLAAGPLADRLPRGSVLRLDGAHNPSAAGPVARAWAAAAGEAPRALVLGMLANKDAGGVLDRLLPGVDRAVAVGVEDHDHHPPAALAAAARARGVRCGTAGSLGEALDAIAAGAPGPVDVLIAGSLYLAGTALMANDEVPD